jgi:hypothetical protein
MEVKVIPTDWCSKILLAGWAIASRNYGLIITVYIIIIIMQLVISRIPGVGQIVSSLLSSFLGIGAYVIQRDLVRGEKSDVKKLFTAFSEPGLLERMWPYFVFSIVTALPQLLLAKSQSMSNVGFIVVYGLVLAPFTMFTGVVMYFQKTTLLESIKLSVKAVVYNIVPLIVYVLIVALASLLGIVLLVLPFFLVVVPALFPTWYMIYASIFEGLEVPALYVRLKAEEKSAAGT